MIRRFELPREKTFTSENRSIDGLAKYSLFFGANGSGKSTIASFLATNAPSIEWSTSAPLQVRVYNRTFIESNFGSNKIPGVFTLGEDQVDLQERIQDGNERLGQLTEQARGLQQRLQEIDDGFKTIRDAIIADCWKIRNDHQDFKSALSPFFKEKETFFTKLTSPSSRETRVDDLQRLAIDLRRLFDSSGQPLPVPPAVSLDEMWEVESNPIWSRRLVSSADLPIAKLVRELGNSEWVHQGLSYLELYPGMCPMCQQPISDAREAELHELFDKVYKQDLDELRELVRVYGQRIEQAKNVVQGVIDSELTFEVCDDLKATFPKWELLVQQNLQAMVEKSRAPSTPVSLQSSQDHFNIGEMLDTTRNWVLAMNQQLTDRSAEQRKFKDRLWAHLRYSVLGSRLDNYLSSKKQYEDSRSQLERSVQALKVQIARLNEELKEMRSGLGGIEPTVNAINQKLASYGFEGFFLKVSATPGFIEVVRPSGESAVASLSEGEKNFVTLLYFMECLNGGFGGEDMSEPLVVVIDDPVSSMDNDLMYLISTMILDMGEKVYNSDCRIEQVIVLTHNAYFFKELLPLKFNDLIKKGKMSFFTIAKKGNVSAVEKRESCPVLDNYTSLWAVVLCEERSIGVPNAMRRIIEYCLKFISIKSLQECRRHFAGQDAFVYLSLIKMVNDGSHSTGDEINYVWNDEAAERYRRVFFELFRVWGLENHCEYMREVVAGYQAEQKT